MVIYLVYLLVFYFSGLRENSRQIKSESVGDSLDRIQIQEPEQNIEEIENTLRAPTPATNEVIDNGRSLLLDENNKDEGHLATKAETYLTESRVEMVECVTKSNGSPAVQWQNEKEDVYNETTGINKNTESAVVLFYITYFT